MLHLVLGTQGPQTSRVCARGGREGGWAAYPGPELGGGGQQEHEALGPRGAAFGGLHAAPEGAPYPVAVREAPEPAQGAHPGDREDRERAKREGNAS